MFTALMAADDKKTTTMSGCLTKDADGGYELTADAGQKVKVTGPADLEKHSAHKVVLHGSEKTLDGKTTFQAERVEHVAASCVAAPAR
jgi:hypothetical protein